VCTVCRRDTCNTAQLNVTGRMRQHKRIERYQSYD
jgi:hypothetical protein